MNNNQIKITTYKTMRGLANRIRDDLNNKDFVLLYAYNGTGKTCLSMEVKKQNKKKNKNQTNTPHILKTYFIGIMILLMRSRSQNYYSILIQNSLAD